MRRWLLRCAALVVASTALAACSSSSPGSGTGSGSSAPASGSKTLTIGFVTDLTGSASSGFTTSKLGIEAYLNHLNASGGVDGYKINYILSDTTSTPTGALTAVQKLVQQDNVFAILEDSSVFYGAEPWALSMGVPVVGSAIDGPYWGNPKDTNLFAAAGVTNEDYMSLGSGQFMKAQGVTKCASIGYAGSPSSALSAEGFIKSCQAAGLASGYINTQVPFGSTNVGPIALAMKNAGVDGVYLPIGPSTAFALVVALHELGVKVKSALLATGYGGDLLASKPTVEAGQGVEFLTEGAPAEANTAAVKERAAELAAVGVTTDPTFAEQEDYLTLSAFTAGLKAAGASPTKQGFMTAMGKITNYDAGGLLAPEKISFRNYTPSQSCLWAAKLTGETFSVVAGTPICSQYVKFSNEAAG
jgi:branched-chain amino acid transport system substrate-binding protein